jgi:EAL domain-containing protein (putative c-di-GMP-specific phosphodiesterase class I)/CheY-like chemotaxis protein
MNSHSSPKTRVLVIEDEKDIRNIIVTYLKFSNYEVIEAEDGIDGLDKARLLLPDLIISDISMPNMDGFTVLEELMEHQNTAQIPFIFLSALSDRNSIRKGMSLGADDYLSKPFTKIELLTAVESRLSKKRQQNMVQCGEDETVKSSNYLSMRFELNKAIEAKELKIMYQPQFEIKSARLAGSEALIRWHQPYRGIILPDQFIPVAEASGLIEPIWDWTLDQVCHQIRDWWTQFGIQLRIMVNLTGSQFNHYRLNEQILEKIKLYAIPPTCLGLDISETIIAKNVERSIAILHSLRALGVHLCLDNFGTTYFTLIHFKRLPFNSIKFDRNFIAEITNKSSNAAIAASVIKMAHQQGMKVIAEGIETRQSPKFVQLEESAVLTTAL